MSNCSSPVTVIGSGNAGLTAAYHLSRNGCDVCLYGSPGFDQPLDDIQQRSGIEALPELVGRQPIAGTCPRSVGKLEDQVVRVVRIRRFGAVELRHQNVCALHKEDELIAHITRGA